MLDLGHVNLWAILFSGSIGSLLAFFWYCPHFLGKIWKKYYEEFSKEIYWVYSINILAAFVLAYTLAQLIFFANAKSVVSGALVGLILWIFFTTLTSLLDFVVTKRRPLNYALNFSYQLISMVLMGGILGLFR